MFLAERIAEGGETRFIARIVVEIRAGDYMHMGPASGAFLAAFRELLMDYPMSDGSEQMRLLSLGRLRPHPQMQSRL
jgi:hypothetical protein